MFGRRLKEFRTDPKRDMTLRDLGEKAGMDYVLLNKIELGLRLPPPLEGIIALADAMGLGESEFEQLLDEAAEENGRVGARFTSDEVRRIKESATANAFFTRRARRKGGKGMNDR